MSISSHLGREEEGSDLCLQDLGTVLDSLGSRPNTSYLRVPIQWPGLWAVEQGQSITQT